MLLRRLPTPTLRALLFSVLLALVFAQTLGAMHRVLHTPGAAHPARASAIEALFAGHDSGHTCDQYDQLNHADLAAGLHTLFVPAAGLTEPAALHPGWQLAAQAAGFLARGPPAQA